MPSPPPLAPHSDSESVQWPGPRTLPPVAVPSAPVTPAPFECTLTGAWNTAPTQILPSLTALFHLDLCSKATFSEGDSGTSFLK